MTYFEQLHQNTAALHYDGTGRNGKRVIIDAAELEPGYYEIVVLSHTKKELAVSTTESLDEARRIYNSYYRDYVEQPAPLTGKYAKLRDDLREVHGIGLSAAAMVSDRGTCNLDSPSLSLPRWNVAKVEQACKEAGGDCFRAGYSKRYVICLPVPGQALKNETAAKAMTEALKNLGYDASTWYRID